MQTVIKKADALSPQTLLDLMILRTAVFVVEQQCPCQEIDVYDKIALHVLLTDDEEIVACCRILPKGAKFPEAAIGRVVAKYRRRGLGRAVMQAAIDHARDTLHEKALVLEAQTYAVPFYQSLGFEPEGEPFLDVGIEHIKMRRTW